MGGARPLEANGRAARLNKERYADFATRYLEALFEGERRRPTVRRHGQAGVVNRSLAFRVTCMKGHGGRPEEQANQGAVVEDTDLSALALASQRGDERSFERLVRILTRPLIAVAYRYTGDWEWARDLTQETWIRVHESIDRYEPGRPFHTWLYAIHRNGCLSHLRKAWVRRETASAGATVRGLSSGSDGVDPEDELDRRDFQRRVIVALAQLSESQRQVFTRVDIEQADQREVAEALGMNFSTLRATLHFARKRMAKILRRTEEER